MDHAKVSLEVVLDRYKLPVQLHQCDVYASTARQLMK